MSKTQNWSVVMILLIGKGIFLKKFFSSFNNRRNERIIIDERKWSPSERVEKRVNNVELVVQSALWKLNREGFYKNSC